MKIYPVIKRISFFDTPASTWSPVFTSPFRIASASLSSSSVCRARLSGLAPYFASVPFSTIKFFADLAQRQVDIQLISQTLRKVTAQQSDNLLHMGFIKSVEYDSLVNTVQEFRTENHLHFIHYILLHPLIIACRIFLCGKSQFLRLHDRLRAGI